MDKRQLTLGPAWRIDLQIEAQRRAEAIDMRRRWFALSPGERRALRRAALERIPAGPVRALIEAEPVPIEIRAFCAVVRDMLEDGFTPSCWRAPRLPDERVFQFNTDSAQVSEVRTDRAGNTRRTARQGECA